MSLLRSLFAVLLLACCTGPLMAHGDEDHETAKVASTAEAASAKVPVQPAQVPEAEEQSRTMTFLRNLHPATVHFPIALLVTAALLELAGALRARWRMDGVVTVLACAGAVGALLAASFGWIHTGLWFGGKEAMVWHRWIGSLLVPAAALVAWLSTRCSSGRGALRFALGALALALLIQGYLGGELAHGAGHLWQN